MLDNTSRHALNLVLSQKFEMDKVVPIREQLQMMMTEPLMR